MCKHSHDSFGYCEILFTISLSPTLSHTHTLSLSPLLVNKMLCDCARFQRLFGSRARVRKSSFFINCFVGVYVKKEKKKKTQK